MSVNGAPVNIVYNQQYGGYGYFNSGRWQMYNVFLDAAMLSVLLHHNNYYYGPPPVYRGNGESPGNQQQPHFSFFWLFVGILVVWLVIRYYKQKMLAANPNSGTMGTRGWTDENIPSGAGTGTVATLAGNLFRSRKPHLRSSPT